MTYMVWLGLKKVRLPLAVHALMSIRRVGGCGMTQIGTRFVTHMHIPKGKYGFTRSLHLPVATLIELVWLCHKIIIFGNIWWIRVF
jgi:hypothetical protein